MRKFLNFVIGGLQQKIFNLVILSIAAVTGVILVVVGTQTTKLKNVVISANEAQRKAIGEVSSEVIESAVTKSAENTSGLQAFAVNTSLLDVSRKIIVISDLVKGFLSSSYSDLRQPVYAPDASTEGVAMLRLLHANETDVEDSNIKNKIENLGNLSSLMVSMFKDGGLDSCFIGTPEGVFLIADDNAKGKLDSEGIPVSMDPRTRPWYTGAVEKGGVFFSDVMRDYFTGEIGIACSCPIYVDGKLVAVVGADIFLGTLDEWISSSYDNGSFTCIINQDGHAIFAPFGQGFISSRDASEAVDLRATSNDALNQFVKDALKGDTSAHLVTLADSEYYMTGSLVDTVGWTVVSVVSKETAFAMISAMEENFDAITETASEGFYSSINREKNTITIILAVFFVLVSANAVILGKRIVGPLGKMTNHIAECKDGGFVFKMDDIYKTKDEIEVLAKAFADLSKRNQLYIEEVKKITSEKERIGAELNVATHIQADMLPSIFPPYPNKKEFDLYATMNPAKEVGGDFYDFFLVDENHIALVIADVSGKGVPAALFMVIAKTLLKNRAQMGGSPSQILFDVNNQLCEGNKTEFFVTVWLGIVDVRSGKGLSSNAGHEHPAICRADGKFELVKYTHSPVLAVMENIQFSERAFELNNGDRLFVYTDGVVEATNSSNELFGEDRMLNALNSEPNATLKGVLDNVKKGIDDFVDGAQQFDDITMLCMEYKGSKKGSGTPS